MTKFRLNDDKELTYEKLSEALTQGQVKVSIDNSANV